MKLFLMIFYRSLIIFFFSILYILLLNKEDVEVLQEVEPIEYLSPVVGFENVTPII